MEEDVTIKVVIVFVLVHAMASEPELVLSLCLSSSESVMAVVKVKLILSASSAVCSADDSIVAVELRFGREESEGVNEKDRVLNGGREKNGPAK